MTRSERFRFLTSQRGPIKLKRSAQIRFALEKATAGTTMILGGGFSLDFHFVAGLKVDHQEISRLFFRLSFDERLGRFQVFRSANPTQPTLGLDSENVERLCHAKAVPTQCREAILQLRSAQDMGIANVGKPHKNH